jgi:hypothetical protein
MAPQHQREYSVRSALAVGGQIPEVLLDLSRGQLALAVAREHRLDAQVGAQDDSPIRTKLLGQLVAI